MAPKRAQMSVKRFYAELDRRMAMEDESWEAYLMRVRGVDFNEQPSDVSAIQEKIELVPLSVFDPSSGAQRPRAPSVSLDGNVQDIPFGHGTRKSSEPPGFQDRDNEKRTENRQGTSWDSFMAEIHGGPQSTAIDVAKKEFNQRGQQSEVGISDSFTADVYGARSKMSQVSGRRETRSVSSSMLQAAPQSEDGMPGSFSADVYGSSKKQNAVDWRRKNTKVGRPLEEALSNSVLASAHSSRPSLSQNDSNGPNFGSPPLVQMSAGIEVDSFMGDVYGAGLQSSQSLAEKHELQIPIYADTGDSKRHSQQTDHEDFFTDATHASGNQGVNAPSLCLPLVPPSGLRYLMADETWQGLSRNESRFSVPGIHGSEQRNPAIEGLSEVRYGSADSAVGPGLDRRTGLSTNDMSSKIGKRKASSASISSSRSDARTKRKKGIDSDKPIMPATHPSLPSPSREVVVNSPIPDDIGAGPSTPRRINAALSPQHEEPSMIEDFSRNATAPQCLTTQRKTYSALETSVLTTPGDSPAVVRRTVTFAAGAQMLKAPLAVSARTASSTSTVSGKGKNKAIAKKPTTLMLPPVVTLQPNTSRQKFTGNSKRKGKEPVTPVTAREYAQMLQTRPVVPITAAISGADLQRKWQHVLLKGFKFFYVAGELTYASQSTKKRMDYIHCRGGVVLPTYDPELVTHIIVDTANPDNPNSSVTLHALGLKKLRDIPQHVPTVKWKWVISAEVVPDDDRSGNFRIVEDGNGGRVTIRMDWEFMHAAFRTRVNAGKSFKDTGRDENGAMASRTARNSEEVNLIEPERGISISTEDAISPPLTTTSGVRQLPINQALSTPNEPGRRNKFNSPGELESRALADKEAQLAQEHRSAAQSVKGNSRTSTASNQVENTAQKLKGFLCDAPKSDPLVTDCPNQDIVDKLGELMELHRAKPTEEDKWRVFSYSKCIPKIRAYPHRITSYEDARKIPGIGDKTALKIKEILETGELRRIEVEHTEDLDVVNLFQGIYGVGQQTAYMWYSAGCRTLDDIRKRKNGIKVSDVQEIGLKYYDDINTRMPRAEAGGIFAAIKAIALSLDRHLRIEIMGSYRRGKATCGDIDILITRPTDDGKTHEGILLDLLSILKEKGIIREHLSLPDFKDDPLEAVYRGLCVRPLREGESKDAKRLMRRIDFLTVPYKSRGAALIYYTGDDIFNRSLRLKANKMGYSLNQRGLFAGVVRSIENKMIKTCDGNIIASETEEEIFQILNVPWQEPWERVRS